AGAKRMMDELETQPSVGAGDAAGEGSRGESSPKEASPAPASSDAFDLAALWGEAIEVMGSRKAVIDWYRDEYKATGTVSTKKMTAEELRHLIEVARTAGDAREEGSEGS